jgi:hypothetical protein
MYYKTGAAFQDNQATVLWSQEIKIESIDGTNLTIYLEVQK